MSDTARRAPSATSWTGSVTLFNGRYHATYDVRPRGTTAMAAARRAIRLALDQARGARPGRRPSLSEIRLMLTRVPATGGRSVTSNQPELPLSDGGGRKVAR